MTQEQAAIFMKYGEVALTIEHRPEHSADGMFGATTHAIILGGALDLLILTYIITKDATDEEKEMVTDYLCVEIKGKEDRSITIY